MNEKQADLARATIEAEAARARLSSTAAALQQRLQPKTLVQDARRGLTEAGVVALDGARANPAPVAGAAVALVLFLARKPLGRLFRRATHRRASRSPSET